MACSNCSTALGGVSKIGSSEDFREKRVKRRSSLPSTPKVNYNHMSMPNVISVSLFISEICMCGVYGLFSCQRKVQDYLILACAMISCDLRMQDQEQRR